MSVKILLFDTETTGFMYWKDGIQKISGYIDIDGEIKELFSFKVQPNLNVEISDESLAITHITREQIAIYPPMKTVYFEIFKMLDKYEKTDMTIMYVLPKQNVMFMLYERFNN